MPNDASRTAPADEANDETRWSTSIHAERKLKIICIGAGASGLLFAYKLQRSFDNFDLTVYEKNKALAGTWFENKYPGCACDVASHAYVYSFEPNNWSSVFAGSDDIEKYLNDFAAKYGLRKYCKLQHQVVGAFWNDKKGIWKVHIRNLETGTNLWDESHVLINACGVLNAWKWPKIPGLESFKGPKMHTATWDRTVDLRGKHVAVIGNGSSAIQLIPNIQPIVSKLTTFVRSPTWIYSLDMEHRAYTEQEKQLFSTDPAAFLELRKKMERRYHKSFPYLFRNSETQAHVRDSIADYMKNTISDETLSKRMIPEWSVGCRRVTPGPGYLEALREENVQVVLGEIERITETGCISQQGRAENQFDVLICATGFDASFVPRFPIIGRHGKNLVEEWTKEPRGYMGLAAADFPNYLIFIGPNSPVANLSALRASEAQADYMLKLINRLQTENIHSFCPKGEAVDDFNEYKDRYMPRMVWSENCRSWYKSDKLDNKVVALWPGSAMHYMEALSEVRYDHWDIRYTGNRFSYLGNGYSQTEMDSTADTAYYVRTKDDGPLLGTKKAVRVMNKSGSRRPARAHAKL